MCFRQIFVTLAILTHYGLGMLYGIKNLVNIGASQHQAIIWTNVDLSMMRPVHI